MLFRNVNFILIILTTLLHNIKANNHDELVMTQILFRHGARQTENFYPTDPNINNTFYPDGIGGLTNDGKMQEYKLGQFLRNKYGVFLGDVYTDDLLTVQSTGYKRTRMSAQLVLAGLWPPGQVQTWNEKLPWIPIPVDYKRIEDEDLLNPVKCPRRKQVLKDLSDPEIQKLYIKPHEDLMNFLENKTLSSVKSPSNLLNLYFIFKTEGDQNLTIPDWAQSIYPEPLTTAASSAYAFFNHYPEIRIINSGYLLKRLLDNIHMKINGTYGSNEKKMMLFSAHDSTLGYMLNIFRPNDQHIPRYASAILFELFKNKMTNKHFIKILYRRTESKVEQISLPECSYCPLEQLEKFLEDILPSKSYAEACKL